MISLTKLVEGFVSPDDTIDLRRRVYLLISISLIGIVTLLPLGYLAIRQGNVFLGAFDIILAAILFLNLVHARINRMRNLNIGVGLFFTGMLFVYAFLTGGVNNSGFVWYFTFPLIALYMMGRLWGFTLSLLILVPALLLFLAGEPPAGLASYSSDFKLRFVPSYLVVLAFSYAFERSRERSQRELARYNRDLRESHDFLEQRVLERTEELKRANEILETEIADKSRTEKELEFKNIILTTQQETSLDGVLVVNEDGKIISYNKRFQEIWKIPDEILSSNSDEAALNFVIESLAAPDEFLDKVRYLYDNPDARSRDEISLKDGRALDRYSAPMNSSDGRPYGRVWYFRDVTDAKMSTAALQESEARYRMLISQATDSILILDPSAPGGPRIVEANEKACEDHGYEMDELLGMPISALDDKASKALVKERVEALMRDGQTTFEATHTRKNGSTFPIEVSARIIHLGGRPHILAIDRDITERKAVEETLKNAKLELEKQNRELKKIDRMKDTLISNVSHELKTPVAKHVMQLEILKSGAATLEGSDILADSFDVMKATLERQQNVIRNILMMSRLEGAPDVKKEEFRLDELLQSIVGEFEPVFSHYGIERSVTLNPVVVRAEREMLWHVYSNIIGNSIKYRAGSKPLVDVRVEERGGSAYATFMDNGQGLSEETVKRAFERFYQESPSQEGIGLGLNIAKMILEQYEGSIDILSEGEGKGAMVITELPLA